jgi:hypothetical protein
MQQRLLNGVTAGVTALTFPGVTYTPAASMGHTLNSSSGASKDPPLVWGSAGSPCPFAVWGGGVSERWAHGTAFSTKPPQARPLGLRLQTLSPALTRARGTRECNLPGPRRPGTTNQQASLDARNSERCGGMAQVQEAH